MNSNLKKAEFFNDKIISTTKILTAVEIEKLEAQNKRLVPEFKANKLEKEAQRNWDLFYKRNETRFFKDRHWTTREFEELLHDEKQPPSEQSERLKLLEVGCGVGNLIFPLLEEQKCGKAHSYYMYACDFSTRAIEFVHSNPYYDESNVKAFQCDITTQQVHSQIPAETLDFCTLIFVLSAIHPTKFNLVVRNLWKLLKPGGIVLFRDYGRYDMAQLRFKPGNKISDNLYMRQDGTRSYYFDKEEIAHLFIENDFEVISNAYVHRRTLNIKEGINVPRIFLQGKFRKQQ